MRKFLILIIHSFFISSLSHSQGCIAVRNISAFGQHLQNENTFSSADWILDIDNRYYKSSKSFVGTKEFYMAENDEVVIESFMTSFSVTRLLNKGWSVGLCVPVSANSRESTEEHGGLGTPRHTTHSFGIGDLHLIVYKWLLKSSPRQKMNFQLGVGIKFPTGDYRYQDNFYRNDTTSVLAPVEVPVQLGDGGTGITTELNVFYIINKTITTFGNFYYLISPREQNGVQNTFGRVPNSMQIKSGYYIASVPDQYSMRAGFNFNFNQLSISAAARMEGVPVYDLVGGSNFARKAGYNFSIEPGMLYKIKRTTFYTYLPVILAREIKQNVPDKILTELTGKYTIRHGGSPDYLLFVGVLFKI